MFFKINIWTLILIAGITGLKAQNLKIQADSLFKNQKFTEAFDLYDSIYNTGKSSPAMLLKMAYIKEGLGDYTKSMIFLNKYYEVTSNKKAFDKLTELAEEHDLRGYEYSDNKLFSSLFNNYRPQLIIVLSVALLILTIAFVNKKRKGILSLGLLSFQIFVMVILAIVVNDFFNSNEAVIKNDQTIVMSGPSAGAEPLFVLEKGHKVDIIESGDLWTKIRWEEKNVWVRNQQLVTL